VNGVKIGSKLVFISSLYQDEHSAWFQGLGNTLESRHSTLSLGDEMMLEQYYLQPLFPLGLPYNNRRITNDDTYKAAR
jgi:hypothetical protein